MPLQLFLGSTSAAFEPTVGGGPVVGGSVDQPTITFAADVSGGAVAGATVDQPTIGFDVTMAGGTVVGETIAQPTITFTATLSGGTVVGSTISQPTITFTADLSGGPVVGATTQGALIFLGESSGGVVIGSTFEPTSDIDVVATGGLLVGQTIAQPFPSFFPPASGGVIVGSHVSGFAVYPIEQSGGPVVGSTFAPTTEINVATAGGIVVGQTTPQPGVTVAVAGSGGVLIGAHLQPPQPPAIFNVSGSGGVLVGSVADQGRIVGGFYHIYMNHGIGDAVSYDFPVDTTSITTWTSPSLPYPGDYSFHVRAFYGHPILEEHNLDARIRVVIDETGTDVTTRPAAPTNLAATTQKGGGVRLSWLYKTPGGRATPSKFNVYTGTPGVSYAAYVQQIAYGSDGRYFAVVTGLADGSTYQFVVRAANATAEEPNTNIVTARSDASGPNPPEQLTASSV